MEEILKEIGLRGAEVKTYINLLELGVCSTGAIIKKTGLQSSTVYNSLELLIKKGLVSYVVKENVKYYHASDPKVLLEITNERRKELVINEAKLRELIPLLSDKRKMNSNKTEATIYEGYSGIKAAFSEIIKTMGRGEEYYVIGARGGLPLIWTRDFFIQFNKKRIKLGIKKKIIFNEEVRRSAGKDEESLPYTQVRYLMESTPSAINIFKDKVIIALWVENPVAFLIKSKETAESYRQHFENLWRIAKK